MCLHTQAMTHGLADVVLGAQPETLQAVLGALVRGGSQHVDPAVRKTCAQVSAVWERSAVRIAAAPLAVRWQPVREDLCAPCGAWLVSRPWSLQEYMIATAGLCAHWLSKSRLSWCIAQLCARYR